MRFKPEILRKLFLALRTWENGIIIWSSKMIKGLKKIFFQQKYQHMKNVDQINEWFATYSRWFTSGLKEFPSLQTNIHQSAMTLKPVHGFKVVAGYK